jgi:glycosyltransferase involved in cell wall biosynthesis
VPAYEYSGGIELILNSFTNAPVNDVEIIICDDSSGDKISTLVNEFQKIHPNLVEYHKNIPPLGAAKNWNSLLDKATGEYILLLHHDEYPSAPKFASDLIDFLKSKEKIDVVVLPCILCDQAGNKIRQHLPEVLQKKILQHFPSYLFRRNVIGPISCLVIRRTFFPYFDEALKWLIDVDLYWRMFSKKMKWVQCNSLKILSTQGRVDSITNKLSNQLSFLRRIELDYLSVKYSSKSLWLHPSSHKIIFFIENVMWGFMRICCLVKSKLQNLFPKITNAKRTIE